MQNSIQTLIEWHNLEHSTQIAHLYDFIGSVQLSYNMHKIILNAQLSKCSSYFRKSANVHFCFLSVCFLKSFNWWFVIILPLRSLALRNTFYIYWPCSDYSALTLVLLKVHRHCHVVWKPFLILNRLKPSNVPSKISSLSVPFKIRILKSNVSSMESLRGFIYLYIMFR